MVLQEGWMGRYREFVRALVKHGNLSVQYQYYKSPVSHDLSLTAQQWQILEFIAEHTGEVENMLTVSEALAIPQSSFSKGVKHLCEHKLVQKCHYKGNKKNIIIEVTPKGFEVYQEHSDRLFKHVFGPAFDALGDVSDEALESVTKALYSLNVRIVDKKADKAMLD